MTGAFQVMAPFAGDILGDALHRAYDDGEDLPDDFIYLLDCLDRVD